MKVPWTFESFQLRELTELDMFPSIPDNWWFLSKLGLNDVQKGALYHDCLLGRSRWGCVWTSIRIAAGR